MILSSPNFKSINVVFDDQNLVTNAGLLAIATLSQSLGLQELIEEKVSLAGLEVQTRGRKRTFGFNRTFGFSGGKLDLEI